MSDNSEIISGISIYFEAVKSMNRRLRYHTKMFLSYQLVLTTIVIINYSYKRENYEEEVIITITLRLNACISRGMG